jgi:3'-phosphoadenosine 5'-phosphosulfate sulfotransferase (PAPS reductase)/FAD synthetase
MKKHIVSFSGGKDSTAMVLKMLELNMTIDKIIFADTTLEFPEMYEWINKIEEYIGIPITRVSANHSWDSWFYGKFTKGRSEGIIRGFPFVVSPCWWTRDTKIIPMTKEQGKDNIIYIGIAADEKKRAQAKQYIDKPNEYKFPLIEWGWSEQDCVDYLKKKGMEHPLQSKFKRTGCWLCPKQSKASLISLYKHYPDLWEKLLQYEKDSPQGFKPNFSLKEFENEIKTKGL